MLLDRIEKYACLPSFLTSIPTFRLLSWKEKLSPCDKSVFICKKKTENNELQIHEYWVISLRSFWLNKKKQFVELLVVFCSDRSPDRSLNFLHILFRYIYTHSYQNIHPIMEKSVTKMKPSKFASSLRKPCLSSSMRLEEIQKTVK